MQVAAFIVLFESGLRRRDGFFAGRLPGLPILLRLLKKLVFSGIIALAIYQHGSRVEGLVPHAGPARPDACPGEMIFDI